MRIARSVSRGRSRRGRSSLPRWRSRAVSASRRCSRTAWRIRVPALAGRTWSRSPMQRCASARRGARYVPTGRSGRRAREPSVVLAGGLDRSRRELCCSSPEMVEAEACRAAAAGRDGGPLGALICALVAVHRFSLVVCISMELQRTTITGQWAWWATRSAVEPSRTSPRKCPRWPITIRSCPWARA